MYADGMSTNLICVFLGMIVEGIGGVIHSARLWSDLFTSLFINISKSKVSLFKKLRMKNSDEGGGRKARYCYYHDLPSPMFVSKASKQSSSNWSHNQRYCKCCKYCK